MRLVVLGAGAVGSVVAGFLARANREVVLLARGAQLAKIRAQGLRLETPDGSFVVHPPIAEQLSLSEWRDGDVALLAVKTQDAASALRALAAPRQVPVVCLSNGLEAERLALRHADEVYGACVNMPATYLLPGVVQAWASPVPGAIDLGRYPEGAGTHADAIRNELRAAGFASEVRTDVMRWKRGKLLSNLANGAEALCGPAARSSEAAELARREGLACFAAAGLSCTTLDEEAARVAGLQAKPIDGAVRGGGSTWQSLARGAASVETDYLNGELALLGRLHGVPTPVNDLLQRLASEAARSGLGPGSMPLDDLLERVKSAGR